ncbi:DinB family protein [Lacinutrix sp. Hel_I_90]|uniref:DinB family protein n=1 Tax=Lacinutrix sp. Hel_I_90 TaxID=1249999 RepID=UPI0005CAF39E|nr:DinB family protein [Lacinutrix sp. Hel_I_90]
MNRILQSTIQTLNKTHKLLSTLSDDKYSDTSVSPYYSSIGSHIRHIYDFYDCALNVEDGRVDLTARKRIACIENSCDSAIKYFDTIISRLKAVDVLNNKELVVIDDLGTGKIEINYTYEALLAQGNSHTIHHYAIINYILDRLNITIDDSDFGYNPTTPKKVTNLN